MIRFKYLHNCTAVQYINQFDYEIKKDGKAGLAYYNLVKYSEGSYLSTRTQQIVNFDKQKTSD